ncbi:MAG: sulfatase-like hydrolase/transferase [Anaerolineales bacterium]|nr:sulfatase-like hydrolase/transferase [Anaerolineales bacterium]
MPTPRQRIHYNVIRRLLSNLHILKNTVFLYTSDHGQTLFENNATWLHCNYTTMEATVPLLMIGKDLPLVATKNFLASHSNIFPTLLDLMEVPLNNEPIFTRHPYFHYQAKRITFIFS